MRDIVRDSIELEKNSTWSALQRQLTRECVRERGKFQEDGGSPPDKCGLSI